jgi:probable phosphoglycerate mutase
MNLYIVRHGETDFNSCERYAGSTDVPLNSDGIRQAENTAKILGDINFDVIISSPLIRAMKTAEIINKYNTKPSIIIIDEFAERNIGVFEGLTREEAKARFPKLWARRCTRQLDDAPTNGETIRQFDNRIARGMNMIREKYADKTVLLVCHGFVSRMINRQIKGLTFEEMHSFTLDNCQVVKYIL